MKKAILYSTILLAVMFTGCKKEDNIPDEEKVPVSFIIDEEVTRTVTSENGVTTFVANDLIGISSQGLSQEMINAEFYVTENGKLGATDPNPFYYKKNTPATFYAHYPYTAAYSNGTVTMTISGDQTSEAKYNANDFITAIGVGNPSQDDGTVSLEFKHRFSMVKVVWNGSTTAYGVEMTGIKPTATWTQDSQSTMTTDVSAQSICVNMWKRTDNMQVYWALIPAQSITGDGTTPFLTVSDAGMTYSYIPATDANINFLAGSVKSVTLNLNPDNTVSAEFSDVSIDGWVNDSEEIGGTTSPAVIGSVKLLEDVVFADAENMSEEGEYSVLNTRTNKGSVQEGEWAKVFNTYKSGEETKESGKFAISDDNALSITAYPGSSWYNRCVFWRPGKDLAEKISPVVYKLTFDVKVDAVNEGELRAPYMIHVMQGNVSSNRFFALYKSDPTKEYEEGKAPTPNVQIFANGKSDGYETVTYYVNFAEICYKEGSTIKSDPVTGTSFDHVLLTVSAHLPSVQNNESHADYGKTLAESYTAYFKNFTFEYVDPNEVPSEN